MVSKQPDALMTIEELAAYLKLSKSSLYQFARAGKVPGVKIGQQWRFHKDIIDAWIKDGVPPAQADGRIQSKKRKKG